MSPLQPAFEAENNHWAYLASVATYKPMAGFSNVVGPTRFVGYFLPAPARCLVTVFQAAANDEALVVPPRRIAIDIKATTAPSSPPAMVRCLRSPARRTPTRSRSLRNIARRPPSASERRQSLRIATA